MREEDGVQHILTANTMDSLLVFTNRGKVYQVKVHELPDAGRTAKGLPIVNVINMQPDETVTTIMKVKDFSSASYLFFTTRLGQVKRTSLDQFQSVRSTGMIAIGLETGRRAGLGPDDERQGRRRAHHPTGPGDPVRRKRRPADGPAGRRRHRHPPRRRATA